MQKSTRTTFLLFIATGLAIVGGIGHDFATLQYMFLRFSEEAGLAGNAIEAGPGDNSTAQPDEAQGLEWVQKRSAQVSTICSLITGCLGLVTTVLLGHFADWKGRKPAAILTAIGNLARIIIFSLTVLLRLPLWMLYLAAVPSGLIGNGFTGFFTLALTMLSDLAAGQAEAPNTPADPSSSPSELVKSEFSENPGVSFSEPTKAAAEARPEELRTTRRRLILLGVFDGFVGCMFAVTQYVAGVIIERTGYNIQVAIIISAGVLGLICVICLPETRPVPTEAVDESVDMASSSGDTKVSSPRNSLGCRTATFFRNPMFILGFLIAFLAAFVLWADVNVSMLYLMGKPFVWQSSQVGLFMGLRNASSAIVTTVIFLTMSLSANCCFSKPTEAQASEQVTPSGAEDETFTAFSRLPPRELSPTTKRYRRRLIAGIVTTLGLLTLSRLVFGSACLTSYPAHTYLAYFALVLGTLAFFFPLLNNLIVDTVKPEERGRFFSVMGFSEVLGMLIGMTVQPLIYSATTETFPGAVFIVSSFLLLMSTSLAGGLACVKPEKYA